MKTTVRTTLGEERPHPPEWRERGRQGAGLLDTNMVIDLSHVDPDDLPEVPMICAITLAELSVGPLVTAKTTERAHRQQVLQLAEAFRRHRAPGGW